MPSPWTNKVLVCDEDSFYKRIILCAPHGLDDDYTADIAYAITKSCAYPSIINGQYKRSSKVNTSKNRADCNRISHIEIGSVKNEFLDPLLNLTDQVTMQSSPALASTGSECLVVQIHGYNGAANKFQNVNTNASRNHPDILIGGMTYGYLSTILCQYIKAATGLDVAFANRKSKYAGLSPNNVNSLFYYGRYADQLAHSLQLEIDISRRLNARKSLDTADRLATALIEVQSIAEGKKSTVPQSSLEEITEI